MDAKEALNRLKEIEDVPSEVIEALEGSSLRQQVANLEARWRDEAEPAITYKQRHESLPKRKEALKRVGVDYDAEKPYGQKTLDSIPADKLDDLDFVASFVKEEGFEASIEAEGRTTEPSGAEVITDFATTASTGPRQRTSQEAANQALLTELDKVPDDDKEAIAAVLAKHGYQSQAES